MDYRVKQYGETTVLVKDGGFEDGTGSRRSRQKPRSYKPISIRLPILALFAAILAGCIGLIEILLHEASKPNASQSPPSATQNTPRPKAVVKKSEASPTCQDLPALTASFSSLEGVVATLCSTYAQSYPTGVKLGLNQSAAFQQWLLTFSSWEASRDAAYTAADLAYDDCERNKIAGTFDQAVTNIQYVGCSTTALEQGCYAGASIYATDGTVTESSSEWCAATQGDMLTLTSQSTTSSTSLPNDGVTGTVLGGSELTLTSQFTPSSSFPYVTQGGELTLTSQTTIDQATITDKQSTSTTLVPEIPSNTGKPTLTQGGELTLTSQSTISSTSPSNNGNTGTVTQGGELTLISQSTTSSTSASDSIITGTVTQGGELTLTSQSTTSSTSPPDSVVTGTVTQGGELTLTSQSTTIQTTTISETVAAPPSDILSLTDQSSQSSSSQTIDSIIVSSAPSSVMLTVTSQSTINRLVPAASSSTIVTGISSSTQFNEIPQISQTTSLSASLTIIITKSESTSGSFNIQSTDELEPVLTMTTTYLSTIQTTDAFGRNTSIVAVVIQPTVETLGASPASSNVLTITTVTLSKSPIKITAQSSTLQTGTSTLTSTSSTTIQRPLSTLSTSEEIVNRKFDSFSYVAAMYLPTVIAVIIKIIWEVVYAAFKMIEPFRRLNKPNGTPAKRSLFSQYLSNTISLDAIQAAINGHSLSILTTCIYLFVTMLATLAASSMTIRATAMNCDIGNNQHMRCNPVWVIDTTLLRIIEVLLGASFVFTISTIFLMVGYRSGIPWNPSSIAAIANLINQEDLLQELRAVEPLVTEEEFADALKHSRYRLAPYENALGEYRYGIVNIPGPTIANTEYLPTSEEPSPRKWLGGYSAVSNPASGSVPTSHNSHRFISRTFESRILDTTQLLTTLSLFAVLLTNWFDAKPDMFNNFVNSGKLPARLTFVGLASFLDMQWKRLEREVRITEPYRRMAKGFARPETTVLLSLNGTCWSRLPSTLYTALRFRHAWFQLLVSVTAVLSDFCIIAISSVLWSEGQIIPSLRIASFVALGISGLMILVMLLVMVWWRRGVVTGMPRTPDTIGVVASYLCSSGFTRAMGSGQFLGVGTRERDELVVDAGWRFGFGVVVGEDGRERWCVDFDMPTSKGAGVERERDGDSDRDREIEGERTRDRYGGGDMRYDRRNLL